MSRKTMYIGVLASPHGEGEAGDGRVCMRALMCGAAAAALVPRAPTALTLLWSTEDSGLLVCFLLTLVCN